MKVLFTKEGSHIYCADREKRIFCIDDVYYDENANTVTQQEEICSDNEDSWYCYWMDNEGLEEPLKAKSTVKIEWEIDDGFGNFGFLNQAGEFVIEPQYAYARNFTKGLACVNLNRTWYKTKEGKRYYENHWGYIDSNGKTVIGFMYDEAHPFNKYGVALVSDLEGGWRLIDIKGDEIPGTRFGYISPYDYDDRFLEFDYSIDDLDGVVGIYDTKERKILIEPSVDAIFELDEDCILVYGSNDECRAGDFRQYYINGKGEIKYPWLYNKGFSIVERPDANNVSAVAVCEFTELDGQPTSCFEHNGKNIQESLSMDCIRQKKSFYCRQNMMKSQICAITSGHVLKLALLQS